MEGYIQIFNNYVKNYDLKNPMIMLKYHHSLRVMELCKRLAEDEGLNEHDIMLASLCGLLHDIGRFNQIKKYNTFDDSKSIDHGDEGFEVLNNDFIKSFTFDENEIEIILKATKYHNKMTYTESNERVCMFIDIVRDADKLDISETITLQITDVTDKIIITEENLNDILNGDLVKNENLRNDADEVLRMISWINDYNFPFSFKYLDKEEIMENKLKLLEIYGENENTLKLRNYVYKKMRKESEK